MLGSKPGSSGRAAVLLITECLSSADACLVFKHLIYLAGKLHHWDFVQILTWHPCALHGSWKAPGFVSPAHLGLLSHGKHIAINCANPGRQKP